jgi:signal transduction histidine kinase
MRRFSSPLLDAVFAALVLAASVPPLVVNHAPWWGYAATAATSLPLALRRRAPFAVGIVVAVGAIVYSRVPDLPQAMPYGVLVVTYTLADLGTRWQRRVTLVAAPLGVLASTGSLPDTLFSYQFPILLSLSAYGLGVAARNRRRYAEAMAARAAAAERERIARDMHDILAHAVSLMVVQAEAGSVVVRSDPERARGVFDTIGEAGRGAMVQLRRLLTNVDGAGAQPPRLTVAAVGELVDEVGRTGLAVSLAIEGEPRPVPADVEAAAYRIVQEALTNVVRHSGSARAAVRLVWSRSELTVTVADEGRGRRAGSTPGRGLVGIAERASACGGSASAGPGSDGRGFAVKATLPVRVGSGSMAEGRA